MCILLSQKHLNKLKEILTDITQELTQILK